MAEEVKSENEGDGKNPTAEKKDHKWVIISAVAGVVLVFLYWRSRSASSTSAGVSSSPYTSAGVPMTAGGGGGGGNSHALSILAGEVSALQYQVAGIANASGGTPTPSTAPSTTPSTTPSTPGNGAGYGTIGIGGKQYDVLGQIGQGNVLNGYAVGGGAPVYFGSAAGGVSQGLGNIKPGNYAYVPAGYGSWVSKTPTMHNAKLP